MSKAFDEGGAKGLLLANLNVGTNGCNIVFDSTLEEDDGTGAKSEETKVEEDEQQQSPHGMVDVTSLINKLETLLGGQSVESIPLVPQLASLREEYAVLEAEGFVEQLTSVRTHTPDIGCNLPDFLPTHLLCFML